MQYLRELPKKIGNEIEIVIETLPGYSAKLESIRNEIEIVTINSFLSLLIREAINAVTVMSLICDDYHINSQPNYCCNGNGHSNGKQQCISEKDHLLRGMRRRAIGGIGARSYLLS